jgi:hypothetical protein
VTVVYVGNGIFWYKEGLTRISEFVSVFPKWYSTMPLPSRSCHLQGIKHRVDYFLGSLQCSGNGSGRCMNRDPFTQSSFPEFKWTSSSWTLDFCFHCCLPIIINSLHVMHVCLCSVSPQSHKVLTSVQRSCLTCITLMWY